MPRKILLQEITIKCNECTYEDSWFGELDDLLNNKIHTHLNTHPYCNIINVTHTFKVGEECGTECLI